MNLLSGQRAIDRAAELQAAEAAAGVRRVRARLPDGPGRADCAGCGDPIPERRREALPGVETCVDCAAARERGR